MLIYDPASTFFSSMIARRYLYRCVVDGRGELCGERIPVGTEEDILAWVKARYKVLGEICVVNKDDIGVCQGCNIIYELCVPSLWPDAATWRPPHVDKRYLVEVEGVEKVFVLRPFPAGHVEWSVKGMLEWNGRAIP